MACRTERVSTRRSDDLRAARDWSEDDHRNVMATIYRSEALRREQASAYRDAMRYGGQDSKSAEEALRVGRMSDASAVSTLAKFEETVKRSGAPVQLEGGAAGLASGGVVIHADGGAVSPLDGGAFGEEPRRSGRESKAPKDETSWKSASWADTVQKMHAVRVHSGEAQRSEMTRANAPIAEPAIGAMLDKKATYRTVVGFFCYTTNTVFVHCRNAGRLMSKFLSNPGEKHHDAAMFAMGFLSAKREMSTLSTRDR
jgi:hypothetical protein